MTGTYLLVEPGRALVFDVTSHCNLGLPDGVPRRTETSTVTVRFLPSGSGTELVLMQTPLTKGYEGVARPRRVGVLSALGQALARATRAH